MFFHSNSDSNQVLVSHLIQWSEILKTYYLISFVGEAEKDRAFSILEAWIKDFELNQSAWKLYLLRVLWTILCLLNWLSSFNKPNSNRFITFANIKLHVETSSTFVESLTYVTYTIFTFFVRFPDSFIQKIQVECKGCILFWNLLSVCNTVNLLQYVATRIHFRFKFLKDFLSSVSSLNLLPFVKQIAFSRTLLDFSKSTVIIPNKEIANLRNFMINVSDISNLGYILTIKTSAGLDPTMQQVKKIKSFSIVESFWHIVYNDFQVILSINNIIKSIFADLILNFGFKTK